MADNGERKTEWLELAALWNSRTQSGSVCSGKLGVLLETLIPSLRGRNGSLVVTRNEQKVAGDSRPDYYLKVVVIMYMQPGDPQIACSSPRWCIRRL